MLIVSLSGGSGSGKTTLATSIVSKFPKGLVGILPVDAYYKDHSHLTPEEKILHNFDHPDSIDFALLLAHLHRLKMSLSAAQPVYSFITCSRTTEIVTIEPTEILLIEGLLTLCNEQLRDQIDLKIYLDASETNRFERIAARDLAERGRSREASAERFYSMVQPMHQAYVEPYKSTADIIIDGNNDNIEAIVESATNAIVTHLKETSDHHIDLLKIPSHVG